MLSTHSLSEDSYPIAILKHKKKAIETVYFTEPTRKTKTQKTPFEAQLKEKIILESDGLYRLTDGYEFEMAPGITQNGGTNPRFINFYLSASNSGKSYQIAQLCRRYLEMYPVNMIAYASANPIENDVNYDDIRHKIKVVDVLNLESPIDFHEEEYRNSLWIFDDCDSGFAASMEDLDARLTREELAKLTVTEKQKALTMLKTKCNIATEWINKSIKSFMMNGRKMKQSLCIVGHKPFEGRMENQIINEATGIVLFPTGIRKNILERFIIEKLSFDKAQAYSILYAESWFRYDWLYISHRSSTPFIITQDKIQLFR